MSDRSAHCQCGALSLRVEGEPKRILICCCTECWVGPAPPMASAPFFRRPGQGNKGPREDLHPLLGRRAVAPSAFLHRVRDNGLFGKPSFALERSSWPMGPSRVKSPCRRSSPRLDGSQGAVGRGADRYSQARAPKLERDEMSLRRRARLAPHA
jgi:hypothetical protein